MKNSFFNTLMAIIILSSLMIGSIATYLTIKFNDADKKECLNSATNPPINLRINQL